MSFRCGIALHAIAQLKEDTTVCHLQEMVHKAAVALFLIWVSSERLVGATAPKSRPHIVFVLADDLGWNDVSFHGSPQIPTPNLDALASTGVVLNNYYVMPVCSPSRGALLSGLYSIHVGLHNGVLKPAQPAALPLGVKIMPEHFKDLGYETHLIGKWHIGYYSLKYTPTCRGFDTFFGFYIGGVDYYSHVLNIPLFLYLAHQATHSGSGSTILQAPEENVEKFPYIGDRNRTIYAGMTDALDQSVGAVLEALEAASMLDDTIIVFSSDNGGAPYKGSPYDNMGSNWPLRGSKDTLWEGGVRGAAFVWARQLCSHRRVSQQLMHVTDWLPTLYSAADSLMGVFYGYRESYATGHLVRVCEQSSRGTLSCVGTKILRMDEPCLTR
ncbi:hypothetical protein HPB50_004145 [Hyalomma asiaticum]|uniref:Uncharacterized protein n=1 Tax=Hyalomma asiaticum TaxID=266040 RepID=A0ACB7SGJ8_HYAAI|nr:hypothetical protein HPB50_004145 [Hyalomma asiaticum]